MSQEHVYPYKACKLVRQQERESNGRASSSSERDCFEPYPPRIFDSEEDALKAATAFCDVRIDNITLINSFHRRKKTGLSV
jgi:hypothetical protein